MGENVGMQEAFGVVIVAVVVLAAVAAVASLLTSGRAYEDLGKGGLSLRDGTDLPPAGEALPVGMSASGAREAEIRQMLEARNARRARRGEAPLDVEEELRALSGPRVDAALLAEIRDLVEGRNARRARQGKAPLDVEAEVRRRLRDLGEP
jgi:hypothetical protein